MVHCVKHRVREHRNSSYPPGTHRFMETDTGMAVVPRGNVESEQGPAGKEQTPALCGSHPISCGELWSGAEMSMPGSVGKLG